MLPYNPAALSKQQLDIVHGKTDFIHCGMQLVTNIKAILAVKRVVIH